MELTKVARNLNIAPFRKHFEKKAKQDMDGVIAHNHLESHAGRTVGEVFDKLEIEAGSRSERLLIGAAGIAALALGALQLGSLLQAGVVGGGSVAYSVALDGVLGAASIAGGVTLVGASQYKFSAAKAASMLGEAASAKADIGDPPKPEETSKPKIESLALEGNDAGYTFGSFTKPGASYLVSGNPLQSGHMLA